MRNFPSPSVYIFRTLMSLRPKREKFCISVDLLPFPNRPATSGFSFASSQENFSSSRTSTTSIRSLQSPSLSNGPTRNNSSQSHQVAKARHQACCSTSTTEEKGMKPISYVRNKYISMTWALRLQRVALQGSFASWAFSSRALWFRVL